MNKVFLYQILLFVSITFFIACSQDNVDAVLKVSETSISFSGEGGTATVQVECNGTWSVSNPGSDWLQVTPSSGDAGTMTLQLTAVENGTGASRKVYVEVNANNGQSRRIAVSEANQIYPSYNTSPKAPDASGMGSNAVQLAAKFTLGWNIGNTFEAPGGETGWGSPVITEDYVKFVKQQGFTAIRIPCAWDWYHVTNKATAKIDPNWLNRVKEVVGYCVANDMYVLLNIHWDGGWLDQNINDLKKDSVNAKQRALWEQIATTMRDFDEHLMFASANEPPAETAEQVDILMSYHQTFVNAVRATGGRNSYRVLVVQGPGTDMERTNLYMKTLPVDKIEGRLAVEVHYYTPSQFCILPDDADWGKMFFYWGAGHHSTIEPERNANWGEEAEVDRLFNMMKTQFTDKGIPVLMGEYGAYRRDDQPKVPLDLATHNDAVDYWITYVTKKAIASGLKPFWWDTGAALDRRNYTVKDQRTIDAIHAGKQ